MLRIELLHRHMLYGTSVGDVKELGSCLEFGFEQHDLDLAKPANLNWLEIAMAMAMAMQL
ncbi:hypothetical protein [Pseudomonas sp. GM48]|uniref:hypothetical protein n=1 Tax=Pseudomonas sp. GM48 TaxID=1144330 RepID=UPI0005186F0B|nr:hypothetical protein [Pseudomonas sp. GM48]